MPVIGDFLYSVCVIDLCQLFNYTSFTRTGSGRCILWIYEPWNTTGSLCSLIYTHAIPFALSMLISISFLCVMSVSLSYFFSIMALYRRNGTHLPGRSVKSMPYCEPREKNVASWPQRLRSISRSTASSGRFSFCCFPHTSRVYGSVCSWVDRKA